MKRHLKILRERTESTVVENDLRGLGQSEIFKNFHPRTYLLCNKDLINDQNLIESFGGKYTKENNITLVNFSKLDHKVATLNAALLCSLLHKKHNNILTLIDYQIPSAEMFEHEHDHEKILQGLALKNFQNFKTSQIHEACKLFCQQSGLTFNSQQEGQYFQFDTHVVEQITNVIASLNVTTTNQRKVG